MSDSKTYFEKERELPVIYKDYDIVVCGAGIAGIAAALASAREGRRTLLIDRMFGAGGLATLGLIAIYLPICDGRGHLVSTGIAEELLQMSVKLGWDDEFPDTWLNPDGSRKAGAEDPASHGDQRCRVFFNPNVFAVQAEQLMKEAGVDILYGTQICGVIRTGSRADAVIVENKNGRSAVPAKGFVDATGDADFFAFAGAPTVNYSEGNKPAAWFCETTGGKNELRILGVSDVQPKDNTNPDLAGGRISGLNALETSEMVINSHMSSLGRFLEGGPESKVHSLTSLASIPQLRMTRRIDGLYTLCEAEEKKHFDDSIGMTADWRFAGPIYEIPFRTLQSPAFTNVLAAGRCISVDDAVWDITRVIPPCAVTGQAAGMALAMCADSVWAADLSALDIADLQKKLSSAGVRLHVEEALGADS